MSVEENLASEIDAAIEKSMADDASQQAEPKDPQQPNTPAEGGDPDNKQLEVEKDPLETSGDETAGETPQAGKTKEGDQQKTESVTISDETVTRAIKAGFTLEDIRTWPSEEALNRTVTEVLAMKEVAKPTEEKQPAEKVDPLADLPKLDPEVYGEEAIQMFNRLTEVVKSQREDIEKFRQQQQDTTQATEAASAREATQWFDGQVKGLGEDFTDALGTGDYNSLSPGSAQLAKRDAIAERVAITLTGYQASGQNAPPREEVFADAARLVLRDEYQHIYEQKLTSDLQKRSTQHIERVGGQQATSKQSPDEAVAAMIDEKYFA